MLKRTINFLSIKTRSEIEEEIRNLIRRQKFCVGNTIFDLRIFFVIEIFSRNYKIQVSEIYKGTIEVTVTGKTSPFVEFSMWIAFFFFLLELIKFITSSSEVEYAELLLPMIWIVWYGAIFYLPIKKDLNLIRSKLS